jgi:hypothetical protein
VRAHVLAALLLASPELHAQAVSVVHEEGLVHGFLRLSTLGGERLADGDLLQTSKADRVTSTLVFRFRDGSRYEETSVFTQRGRFRLVSHRVAYDGPAFPRTLDASIELASGRVEVRYTEDGKEATIAERMDLPPDLANGLVLTLLKNVSPETATTGASLLAFRPKPLLVKLELSPAGREPFATGATEREAWRYEVAVEIPGVKGVLASLLDKTPPDSYVWILGGEAPAFVKSESPLYTGGPLWRIELESPVWPAGRPAAPEGN